MPTTTLTSGNDLFYFVGNDDEADLIDETIFGGAGTDVTVTGAGVNVNVDNVDATGDDSIQGSQGDDIIYGGDGADTISSSFAVNFPFIPTEDDGGDTIYGGSGDDVINTFGPDGATPSSIHDTVYGGDGNDSIVGATDNSFSAIARTDSLYGGTGNDTIDGNTGTDVIYGGDGNDLILAREGVDTTDGGAGIDTIDFSNDAGAVVFTMQDGATTVTGGATEIESNVNYENVVGSSVADTITGSDADNSIAGGAGADLLTGGGGSDTFVSGGGDDSIVGSEDVGDTDIDVIDYSNESNGVNVAYSGDEAGVAAGISTGTDTFAEIERLIFTDQGDGVNAANDTVGVTLETQGGDDFVAAGQGADSLDGGTGNDTLSYTNSADAVTLDLETGTGTGGDAEGDTFTDFEFVTASENDDSVTGSAAGDTIDGSGGDDDIDGAGGNDTLFGGDGDDYFSVVGGNGNDSIVGGEGGEDGRLEPVTGDTLTGDTINIIAPANGSFDVIYSGDNNEAGTINILDDQGAIVDTVSFAQIENIVCFARGTMILTPEGEVAIEDLAEGDLVTTRDRGAQPLRWIGSQEVNARGKKAPVVIKAGALGNDRDLRVSQLHRMLLSDWRAQLMFDETEVLAAAKHLVNGDTIYIEEAADQTVEYFHMLFDTHEIVTANGAAAESFHPGEQGIGWMAEDTRGEIFEIFPELRVEIDGYGPAARASLKAYEARALKR